MYFKVGPYTYTLRITEGKIVDSGTARMGATVECDREILIAADCPPGQRLDVLFRQIFAAWTFAVGTPKTAPQWADLATTAFRAFMRDLVNAGGEMAIQRLQPGESPIGSTRIALTRNRYCGKCEATIAGGSVSCKPAPVGGLVELSLHCESCNHIQQWNELATMGGLPSGHVVGKPLYLRGSSVADFLARECVTA